MAALVFIEIAADTPRYICTWEAAFLCDASRWSDRRAEWGRADANPEGEAAPKLIVLTPGARLRSKH